MTPKINSEVSRAIGFMCGHKEQKFVPLQIVLTANLEIMPETLSRKLRDYARVKNGPICKTYYRNAKGTRIALYSANKQYKENK